MRVVGSFGGRASGAERERSHHAVGVSHRFCQILRFETLPSRDRKVILRQPISNHFERQAVLTNSHKLGEPTLLFYCQTVRHRHTKRQ